MNCKAFSLPTVRQAHKRFSALLVGLLLVCSVEAVAQTRNNAADSRIRFGVYGHYTGNFHSAKFPTSDGFGANKCCVGFESGFGTGYAFGGLLELPIPSDETWLQTAQPVWMRDVFPRFSVMLRGGFVNHSGTLTALGDTLLPVNGTPSRVNVLHKLETELWSWGGETAIQYRFAERWRALLGVRFGVFSRKLYTQTQSLRESTASARWSNGSTVDTIAFASTIPNVQALNLDASALVGLQYEIPLTAKGTLILAPEVLYSQPLSNIVPNRQWSHGRLHGGIVLKVAIEPPLPPPLTAPEAVPVPPPPPPVATKSRALDVRVSAITSDTNGTTSNAARIRVEEFLERRVTPLLLNIFFDDKSAEIPARYVRVKPIESENFRESSLSHLGTLDLYYHLLNILGKRMRAIPNGKLTITGCLGAVGFGPFSEENDPTLARRRADAVRDYLQTVWAIDGDRLIVKERGLPEKFSSTSDELAAALDVDVEENRRVELESDNWELIKPVLHDDTLRVVSLPNIEFFPVVQSEAGVQSWSIQAAQGNTVLKIFSGETTTPDARYMWNVRSTEAPRTNEDLVYTLRATDRDGNIKTASGSLAVETITIQQKRQKRVNDVELSQYRLIDFEFQKSDVSDRHKRIVSEYIRPFCKPTSKVMVSGYTDMLGNAQKNKRLSLDRAQAISRELGVGQRTVQGIGGRPSFTNDIPEGRFYSRSVDIRIETPVR